MELNISDSARQSANNWSWSGHTGDAIIDDAHKRADGFRNNFEREIKRGLSDEQEAYLSDREKQFCALVSEYANDQNRRSGENPSWVVAGPSKYNFSRFEKLQNRQRASAEDYERKINAFIENTRKHLNDTFTAEKQIEQFETGNMWNVKIDLSDPLAKEKLTAKLERLEKHQDHMKRLNAWYKKNGTCKGFEGLTDELALKIDADINSNCSFCKLPFPSFELSNNNAKIKATKERLAELEKRNSEPQEKSVQGNGVKLVKNTEQDRVQLIFDDKPDEETRELLKSNGFRWSPRNTAWQRQLTDNGIRAAEKIINEVSK